MSEFERSEEDSVEHYSIDTTFLINRYLLLREIGYGAYSSVWMAYDVDSHSFCAIKINNPRDDDSMQLELDIGRMVQHMVVEKSFISTPRDNFTIKNGDHEHSCAVFPLYGGSILNVLNSHRYRSGIPFLLSLHFLSHLLTAFDHLHNTFKAIHTDIRPDNILVSDLPVEYLQFMEAYRTEMRRMLSDKKIDNRRIYESVNKVIVEKLKDAKISDSSRQGYTYALSSAAHCVLHDFGLVRNDDDTTETISVIDYRAPETILQLPNSRSCDVWSLGCTFYHMLTGKMLFDEDELEEESEYSRDMNMLYEIYSVSGYTPVALINASPVKNHFFVTNKRKTLLAKDFDCPMKRRPLRDLLEKNIAAKLSKRSLDFLSSLLEQLLHADPKVRRQLKYPHLVREIRNFLRSNKFQ